MFHFKRTAMVMPIIAATFLTGCLDQIGGGNVSDEHISEIVKKTLMEKPEIIIESLEVYRKNEQAKKSEQQKNILEKETKALTDDGYSLVLGNPDGDVTIVAFKDYRCGYCKKSWPTIQELIKTDKNVRVVFKEFPVLGPESEIASRYALASSLQGVEKYKAFNNDLMNHKGPWDAKTLKEIAAKHKLDESGLDKAAGGKFVTDALISNKKLGQGLGLQGTPAFVIGKQVIPGAVPLEFFKEAIEKARKDQSDAGSDTDTESDSEE